MLPEKSTKTTIDVPRASAAATACEPKSVAPISRSVLRRRATRTLPCKDSATAELREISRLARQRSRDLAWSRVNGVARPTRTASAPEKIPDVGDDRILAEQRRALDRQRGLVVQDVLPPARGQEFRNHDGGDGEFRMTVTPTTPSEPCAAPGAETPRSRPPHRPRPTP